MVKQVYVNYPNPAFSIHGDPNCASIRQMNKPEQRQINVTIDNVGGVLTQFINGDVSFASNPAKNDLWLTIDLSSDDQERGLVHVLQAILSRRYAPLGRAEVSLHCG
jgi:hypothetical protein